MDTSASAYTTEFGVHRVTRGDCDKTKLVVEGRCYKGTIAVGHEFRAICTAIVEKTPTEYKDVGRCHLAEIQLTVTKIEAYNRELPEIEAGLTARLHLSGVGADKITENILLCSD